ncbi:MAG: HD domain-containing phosphohydrolase [Candidatus Gastranaerophilaceae bacterium]
MKILIIDDNSNNQKILSLFFSKNNIEVRTASNFDTAVDKLNKSIDLVLIDANLSGKNGYDTCKKIKSMEDFKHTPVIIISRESNTDDIVKAFASGANDYVTAPFKPDELLERVQTQIKLRDLNEQLREEEVKRITENQLETIFSLAKSAQTKDDDTGKHIERVKRYTKILVQELTKPIYKQKITPEYIKTVELASTLHDIGKVNIPDEIVFKPDKLTEKEFDQMKTHTTLGYNMLKEVYEQFNGNDFIKIAMNIAKYHHERYDGLGYPEGLKKEEIPLEARIVAVADVYDALRTQKPYHDAISHEKAFEVIKGGRELQFDYLIVKALKQVHREFEKVWNELSD